MARPLRGTLKPLDDGRYQASLPVERGGTKRRTATFATEAVAQRWLDDGKTALAAGQPLPDPKPYLRNATAERPSGPPALRTARQAIEHWRAQTYDVLGKAKPKRRNQVRADIDNHILPFLDGIGVVELNDISREVVTDFVRFLSGWPLAYHHFDGDNPRPLENSTATRVLGTLKLFLKAMVGRGRLTHDPSIDVTTSDPRGGSTRPKRKGPVLELTDCARLAAHLSVVHQLALWLLRLLGLRISEAFGLRVGHVKDLGDYGLLTVEAQGGSKFEIRDKDSGQFRQVDCKDELKNEASVRVMWVPPVLMALVRIVIAAFHTDPDTGEVDTDARLIPGIQDADVSGAHSFRTALKHAGAAAGLGGDFTRWLHPHHLRRSVSTELRYSGEFEDLYWRRFLGHQAGSQVAEQSYLLDDPEHRELKAMANWLDERVRAEVGDLAIPTSVAHQWGRCHPIRQRLTYVETVLAFHGWQVPGDEADDPWLSSTQVAGLLGCHPSKAREKMADGVIPAKLRAWGSRNCWQARRSDVLAYRKHLDERLDLGEVTPSSRTPPNLAQAREEGRDGSSEQVPRGVPRAGCSAGAR